MKEGADYKDVKAYGDNLRAFLCRYDWEWFCTLNMKNGSGFSEAEKYLKKWRLQVVDKQKIQVCYQGLVSFDPHPHIHLLMAGLNRYHCNLRHANHGGCELYWSGLTKEKAVIKPIYDISGAAEYIAKMNARPGRFELISPYGKEVMEKKALDGPQLPLPTHAEFMKYCELTWNMVHHFLNADKLCRK